MKINKTLFLYFFVFTFSLMNGHFAWAQNGSVRGKVTDANNNEAIAFANVVVYGSQFGSTTDINGDFEIKGIEPGYIRLQVSYVGYETKISADIMLTNNSEPYVEIKLISSSVQLEEFQVIISPFEKVEEAPLSMQSIGVKQIESNPGSNRDISRVIQSFPGVGSTPAFRNDIIIRGGGPSENRFFLDEVEIPVLNHFSTQGASGGPVGIINADFIENVDFFSGSFLANRYNALSGVLEFSQKDGSMDKTNFQVAVGASEAAFTVNGPLGKRSNYIVSVRRSYLQFLFLALGLPFLPTFNDYQFKLRTNFNTKNQLTIISIGSLDHLVLNEDIEDPEPSQEFILAEVPVNDQWSYTIGAVYKNFFNNGFHTLVLSRNMLDNRFYKYPDNDETQEKTYDYKSREAENKFRYELNLRKNGYKISVSANLEYAKYLNQTYQKLYFEDSVYYYNYRSELDLIKYGLSGQVSKRILKNRLLISLGLRMDAMNYNDEMNNLLDQFSPRLLLSYQLKEKLSINGGIGRYFQQPAYTTLGIRTEDGELINENSARYIGAVHYTLGIEYQANERFLFSVEGFYKDYFQYPIDIITGASLANEGAAYSGVAGASPATFTGVGEAAGFEVLSRINTNTFSLIAAYTYVRSLFSDIHGELIPSSWDSQHLLTITGVKDLNKNWRVGFKWRFVGGLPYTPYDMETSAQVEAWDAKGGPYLDYDALNSERFSSFHQLDLRVDKNFFYQKWSLMLYFDIQNIYNFQAEQKDYILREKNDDGSYKTVNNGTEYVLQRIPNTSGTVLPTLGIIAKF